MKIAAVYTGQGLSEPLKKCFLSYIPDLTLVNLIDDSLILEMQKTKSLTPKLTSRLINYFQIADTMEADLILETCSSVGDSVYIGEKLVNTPIMRVDEPMAKKAVSEHTKIGVIATLETTLKPTCSLLYREAEKIGKKIEVEEGLADGAYLALIGGNPQLHDDKIMETALKLSKKVDCIVLAQGSMMRMEEALNDACGGVPVLSSPPLCAQYIKEKFGTSK